MSYNFLPYDQEQLFLMPPSLREWVREDSLAHFLSEVLDHLDTAGRLQSFYARYRADGWGRAAHHPRMMVKVLLYGYALGVRSSRKIAHALEHDVAFRFLAANQRPDFRTISDFRKENRAELEALFVEALKLCEEAGLVKLERVALDGRKGAANAALDQNRTREAIAREVARLLEEAERTDAEEDALYGREQCGDELPEGLRTKADRRRRLSEAQARLDAEAERAKEAQREKLRAREEAEQKTGRKKRGRKPKDPEAVVDRDKKANVTDPDSRILKTRRGWVQGYNAQAAADCSSQVVVACDVTQEENDVGQLAPMLERCEAQAGRRPKQGVADAGYWSEANAALEDAGTELFLATTKEWKQRKALREKGPPRGRIPKDLTTQERMERKLRTKRGKEAYAQRGSTIEPVFGQMEGRGLNRFLVRGLAAVKTEWSLWCTTHNLLKLWRSGWRVRGSAAGAA
jgi:transposase